MVFVRLDVHGQLGHVGGAGGVDAFGVLAGDLDELFVLHAVGADEGNVDLLFGKLLDELGSFGMVAAEDDAVSAGLADLLDHRAVVHGAGGDAFFKDDLDAALFEHFAGIVHEAAAVVALVVQEGDLLQAELVLGEGAGEVAGHVVGGDGAEEVGVVALLGQLRRGGRRRNGHNLGVVVDRQGGLGCAGTDGAHNGHGAFGKDLGGGVGAEFGLALVVFGDDFNLFAENAALGVVFVGDDASRVKARHTVGNEVAGVCTGNADFDRIGSMHRGGHGHDGHTRKSRFHPCACHKETSPSFIGIVGVIGQARLSEAVHAEKGAWGGAMPSLRFFG